MDLKTIVQTIAQITETKGITRGKVFEAIEEALAAAYKKEYLNRGTIVRAELNAKSGDVAFSQIKEVVDETTVRMVEEGEVEEEDQGAKEAPRYNPDRHILVGDAKKVKQDAKVGDEIVFPLPPKTDFGRIAIQAAKQAILQKLRESERASVVAEFQGKEGEIVSGIVQRIERGNIFVDLGRATGIMFGSESIPGEHYRSGERLRFCVLAVQTDSKSPGIILSRAHPKFVVKLMTLEVPEISDGVVEVKAIAREPGSRTKVAVYSKVEGVDPVGSCVGQRGTRVMAVTNELGQEKLDIIEWSEDPEKFVGNSLSPAKVKLVEIMTKREARVLVADDQLSLAIGKGGQNVRLAAKLTGWKIDVRSQARPEEELEGGVGRAPEEVENAETPVENFDKPVYHKVDDED
ncbi:MAG: transcription termination/antitermination protein NusA [Candidatus Colwellbacteria bacterium]|nr:transcription termination/antitermination protein NusA [Candidatus Colwellbacteria bacterium]